MEKPPPAARAHGSAISGFGGTPSGSRKLTMSASMSGNVRRMPSDRAASTSSLAASAGPAERRRTVATVSSAGALRADGRRRSEIKILTSGHHQGCGDVTSITITIRTSIISSISHHHHHAPAPGHARARAVAWPHAYKYVNERPDHPCERPRAMRPRTHTSMHTHTRAHREAPVSILSPIPGSQKNGQKKRE